MFSFAEFILNTSSRKLFHRNEIINISARAYEILLLLIKNQGEVMTKESLLQEIWADSYVEESNLAVHISALRRVLGEKCGERKFIETVSGRGYCFVMPVKLLKKIPSKTIKNTNLTSFKSCLFNELSIAVMPFDFKNKEDEYFADGITENLIGNLSKLPNLKVTAFSAIKKYRDSKLDLQEIGFQLGAENILVGEIFDNSDNLSIHLEMIKASDMSHLWAIDCYSETKDIFRLKKIVSLTVAEKLQITLTPINLSQISEPHQIDFETHKLFLKGKFILENTFVVSKTKESLFQAIEIFQQVLQKAPYFASVYICLANCYVNLNHYFYLTSEEAILKAKTYIQLGLSLDSNNSDAYRLIGEMNILLEKNWKEAEESLLFSIQLNPHNLQALNWLGILSMLLGKFDEAEDYYLKALDLNPTALIILMGLCRVAFYRRDYEKAFIYAQEALDLDPHFFSPFVFSALIKTQSGDFNQAIQFIDKAISMQESLESLAIKSYIYAKFGDLKNARKIFKQILNNPELGIIDDYELAVLYSVLGKFDEAFATLEKGFLVQSLHVCLIKIDPRIDGLRLDKRYGAFIEKLKIN